MRLMIVLVAVGWTVLIVAGCTELGGRDLAVHGSTLRYYPPVAAEEAQHLADYLDQQGFFGDDRSLTVHLRKDQGDYVVAYPVKQGAAQDEQYLQVAKLLSREISAAVFGGAEVTLQLTDAQWQVQRSVSGSEAPGTTITVRGNTLTYYAPVAADEAQRLAAYLDQQGFFVDGRAVQVRLRKENDVYQFVLPVKKGLDRDEGTVLQLKLLAGMLSTGVFHGAEVDLHLADEYWQDLRVVVAP